MIVSYIQKQKLTPFLSFLKLVFETFFIDVNLERTNSTCVLITPGCGVFDVDKELLGMTNQRLLDVGEFILRHVIQF